MATLRPAASRSFLAASASSLEIPSLMFLGKPVMNSLASLRPTPVRPRMAFRAATRLESSTASRTTSKASLAPSSSAAAAPPAAPGAIIIIPPPAAAEASTPKVSSICLTSWEASSRDMVLSLSTISETTGETSEGSSPSRTRTLRYWRGALICVRKLTGAVRLETTEVAKAVSRPLKARVQSTTTRETLTMAERPRTVRDMVCGVPDLGR
mmetsp:Transcript_21726/g.43602  ORF Transcript_21726/g.43602 Transcript_21726/m.43602 type:complete len:211 (+) Transcript_21726:322-954(+)